jgi:hypothetical protein
MQKRTLSNGQTIGNPTQRSPQVKYYLTHSEINALIVTLAALSIPAISILTLTLSFGV